MDGWIKQDSNIKKQLQNETEFIIFLTGNNNF